MAGESSVAVTVSVVVCFVVLVFSAQVEREEEEWLQAASEKCQPLEGQKAESQTRLLLLQTS